MRGFYRLVLGMGVLLLASPALAETSTEDDKKKVGAQLAAPADKDKVGVQLAAPADKDKVGAQLAAPADKDKVGAQLAAPADQDKVGAQLAAPADQDKVGAQLAAPSVAPSRQNAGQLASAGIFAGSSNKPWSIVTTLQLRSKIVTDKDPANDRSLLYGLQGMYSFSNRISVRTRMGFNQRFFSEPNESGFLFQDLRVGGIYSHGLPWKLPDWAGRMQFVHIVDVLTPTSRASQNQSLYLATQQTSLLTWTPGWDLTFGLSETWQQRFNKYAERAGLDGGMNVQSVVVGSLFLQYAPILGLQLGADVYSSWSRRYNSRESFASASSAQGFWSQQFGWNVYAYYRVMPMLELGASVEHSQSVLDGGVLRIHVINRDETEFAFLVRGIF